MSWQRGTWKHVVHLPGPSTRPIQMPMLRTSTAEPAVLRMSSQHAGRRLYLQRIAVTRSPEPHLWEKLSHTHKKFVFQWYICVCLSCESFPVLQLGVSVTMRAHTVFVYFSLLLTMFSRDSVVSIETWLRADDSRFESRYGKCFFSLAFPKRPNRLWGSPILLSHGYRSRLPRR